MQQQPHYTQNNVVQSPGTGGTLMQLLQNPYGMNQGETHQYAQPFPSPAAQVAVTQQGQQYLAQTTPVHMNYQQTAAQEYARIRQEREQLEKKQHMLLQKQQLQRQQLQVRNRQQQLRDHSTSGTQHPYGYAAPGSAPGFAPGSAPTANRKVSNRKRNSRTPQNQMVNSGGGPIRRGSAGAAGTIQNQQQSMSQMARYYPQQYQQRTPAIRYPVKQQIVSPLAMVPVQQVEPEQPTPSGLPDIVKQYGSIQIRVIRAVDKDMRIFDY